MSTPPNDDAAFQLMPWTKGTATNTIVEHATNASSSGLVPAMSPGMRKTNTTARLYASPMSARRPCHAATTIMMIAAIAPQISRLLVRS
ncbi:hypothetical protein AYJ05_06380 [Corynebacterium stationis]|uniref:Uncharacterized protein n=1 Tax=Corynebacterium stationis TaxID=1705 RepID=A0A177IP65_9CORY|nr:hypothetical protein AYJ05_06380 [Corynebacterium stationis]